MKVLYIDVYFLINFTVDALAIYCALWLCKLRSGIGRTVISSVIGAATSCVIIMTDPDPIRYSILLLASILICCFILVPRASSVGKIKVFVGVLVFETLIGGIVFWLYSELDKILLPVIDTGAQGVENKKLLLAMMVLLSMGIIKLVFRIYSGTLKTKCGSVRITLCGKSAVITGFFDSGNMTRDPLSAKPVIIVKYKPIEELLLPFGGRHIFDEPTDEIKRRMKLIPVKSINEGKLLYGIMADDLYVTAGKRCEPVSAVIAIDFEDGDFGGYDAVIPSSLI